MNIGIIKQTLCVDAAVFEDISTAQAFLERGVWDADEVHELPPGFGIGDSYTGGEWVKAPVPEPPDPPEPEPQETKYTEQERVDWLEGFMEASGYTPDSGAADE